MIPHMPEPRYITTNGVRLAYDDVGEGPAILFIHGFMFDRTMWRDQVVGLEGWRRIAPDLRGMGLSEAPENGYSMDVYADDLAALLDVLGIERVVLCGLSMGGYIAFEFIRRHRERVAALVIMDSRAEADSPEREASRNDMIARVRRGEAKALVEELAPIFLAEDAHTNVQKRLKEMMQRTPPAGIIGALEAIRDRPDSTRLLQSLANLPTLLLIGEHDRRTPFASMQTMANHIPNAKLGMIPNAGHVPPIENPEKTADRLRRFLNGLETNEKSNLV